jgi:uncharacterized membrane protein (UPF0127 family)
MLTMDPGLKPRPHALQHGGARACALALLLAAAACASDAPRAVIRTAGGPRTLRLEIVDTPAARSRGLMYRRELPDGTGMLFVFDEESDHAFWMKNTFIPLDMVFIARGGRIVSIHERATPRSLEPIRSAGPALAVLELAGGTVARQGIAVGDLVDGPGLS